MTSFDKRKPILVGPWGGQGGSSWDDGVWTGITKLMISYGVGIYTIQVEYDKNGTLLWSDKHGGRAGPKTDIVKLDYPQEYLTSIHGHHGSLNERGPVFIRSLSFESNIRTYGPYGTNEEGTYFTFPMNGGKIVGFHGRAGWYVDAIGAYLEPINSISKYPSSTSAQSQGYSMVQALENGYDVILAFRQKNNLMNGESSNYISESKMNQSHNQTVVYNANTLERIPSTTVKGAVSHGTWGGAGGTTFDDGIYTGIRQITLSRNMGIVYLRVLYDKNGEATWGGKNGGNGGYKSDKITFDYPYEVLTHITGFHGPTMVMGPTIIKSLTFHTTKARYGPYGDEQGESFSTNIREGKIVGFYGRKGWFLDAIGVHVMEGKVIVPIRPPNAKILPQVNKIVAKEEPQSPRKTNKFEIPRRGSVDELKKKVVVVQEPAIDGTGPWGGDGGRQWDDGVFTGIKQIHLTRKESICSIQIEYDRNGQSVWSVKHGGNEADNLGANTIRMKLEYPNEVLRSISGYYGEERGRMVIKSLTFTTSRRKMGPYGEEKGTFFSSVTTDGKILGFHGRSDMYLDSIGVHMQHWLGNSNASNKYGNLVKSSFTKIFT
ncbi:jacalin-related lectin 3 isoform X2 [Impatiens glandulifera]|uniref:jacalin-related lectin 3 isoform X2 n=1 Tax=Impatiens glandulifera TaxID=253017 RepID=UPI001FB0E4D2|nr:jacalin-related lectin 3 isoform X2 [Impatiens glandulifera]